MITTIKHRSSITASLKTVSGSFVDQFLSRTQVYFCPDLQTTFLHATHIEVCKEVIIQISAVWGNCTC